MAISVCDMDGEWANVSCSVARPCKRLFKRVNDVINTRCNGAQSKERKQDRSCRQHTPQLNRSGKRHIENIQDLTTQRMLRTTGRVTQKQHRNSGAQKSNTQIGKINNDVDAELWKAAPLKTVRVLSLENVSKLHKWCIHCCIIASQNVSEHNA